VYIFEPSEVSSIVVELVLRWSTALPDQCTFVCNLTA